MAEERRRWKSGSRLSVRVRLLAIALLPTLVVLPLFLGWAMVRYDYPVAATVVGLLLGRLLENNVLRTWQISGGDPSFILGRPITLVLVALLVLALTWRPLKAIVGRRAAVAR